MAYQMTVHPLKLSFPHAGPPSPNKGQKTVTEKTMGVLLQVTRVPTLTQTTTFVLLLINNLSADP